MPITMENNISDLGPFDVLCGRDKLSYNNVGNRRFRVMINVNLPHYLKCKTRTDRSKMILALTYDLQIISCHFRFFRRVKGADKENDCSTLVELDHKQTREKIAHALRDAASQQKNMQTKQDFERKERTRSMSVNEANIRSMKRIFDEKQTRSMSANGADIRVDYFDINGGHRNVERQAYCKSARSFVTDFPNEAKDVKEQSKIREFRLSEIFDYDYCVS